MALITTAQLKDWLSITDTDDDTRITYAVTSANRAIERYCGRGFDKVAVGSETTRSYIADDLRVLLVHDFWDATNLVVKTDQNNDGIAELTWAVNTDFQIEPLNSLDGDIYSPYYRIVAVGPRRFPTYGYRARVQVTAAWGWTTIPDDVVTATLIKAARLFKRKDSPEGILGGYVDGGTVRVTQREDPDAMALLRPYVRTDRRALVG